MKRKKRTRRDTKEITQLVTNNVEELRMIRTNLGFVDKDIHTMMLTSYSPAEGKSTLIACMAEIFAQQDKKILVIDADFRRPTQYKKFGLSNENGLSLLLQSQEEAKWGNYVLDTFFENVYLLPAGPLPPNPTDLIEKEAFHNLLENAKEIFDMVLIDAPPAGIADTKILASKVDGVVIVVEDNRIRRQQFKNTITVMEESEAKILGVIINKAKQNKKDGNYYYNY
ncbi:CpsD/CapB family tyrosine-protein kinase [Listeria booriae]|uniref:CpsD/CapB family tyrosine-protein kinase n=1 Tax=Listeria booriae TaxID=1552123 RepID=UPI0016283F45|nr:CpsD/CapB family tyrosine-protein kinase [Listeria booriae]MBC2324170.1 CpsD/CapB family tyrosine-protein kinase [Listeria booriae]MBC2327821.1 CpsD/CapB family tyrosine-protein kinase [Listeria booriae]MCD2208031.1 CpsD/CapB family tyrosine-protein kinase [Listeria booriae]